MAGASALVPWQDLRLSPLFELFALALGLIFGSFANVCIHRLPLGLSVVHPRSRCPRCQAPIGALDNIPVLSWLFLRGRCRHCHEPISVRYPAVELANGMLWLWAALTLGPAWPAAVAMVFSSAMLVLALIDYDHQILPDVITLPGIVLSLALAAWPEGWSGFLPALAAAAGGYIGCWAVAVIARRVYGRDALGQGDWKMVAFLGAFLGWDRMMVAVFVGCLLGAIVGVSLVQMQRLGRRDQIPLGTFLAVGGVAALYFGADLIDWYRGFFGG